MKRTLRTLIEMVYKKFPGMHHPPALNMPIEEGTQYCALLSALQIVASIGEGRPLSEDELRKYGEEFIARYGLMDKEELFDFLRGPPDILDMELFKSDLPKVLPKAFLDRHKRN